MIDTTTTEPIERLPFDVLEPTIRDVETTVRQVGWHLEPRRRHRFAELLRSLAEAVDEKAVDADAQADGVTQLPLFG